MRLPYIYDKICHLDDSGNVLFLSDDLGVRFFPVVRSHHRILSISGCYTSTQLRRKLHNGSAFLCSVDDLPYIV